MERNHRITIQNLIEVIRSTGNYRYNRDFADELNNAGISDDELKWCGIFDNKVFNASTEMNKYVLSYREVYEDEYVIKAASKEEAIEILMHNLMDGKYESPETCIDSNVTLKCVIN